MNWVLLVLAAVGCAGVGWVVGWVDEDEGLKTGFFVVVGFIGLGGIATMLAMGTAACVAEEYPIGSACNEAPTSLCDGYSVHQERCQGESLISMATFGLGMLFAGGAYSIAREKAKASQG